MLFPRFANNALSRLHIGGVFLHVASFTLRVLSNVRPESLHVCSFNCLLICTCLNGYSNIIIERERERGGAGTEVKCLVSSRQVGVLRLEQVFTSSPNSISFTATFLCSSSTSSLRILHSRFSLSSKMWWKDLFDRGVKHIVYTHDCVFVFCTVCEFSWPLNFSPSQMPSTSWFGLHHQSCSFLRLLVASAHVISKSSKSYIDICHTVVRVPCEMQPLPSSTGNCHQCLWCHSSSQLRISVLPS